MLRVPLIHARPGMTLAVPVEHPSCPSTILLRANVALDAHAIARLRELGAGHVWIRHPSLEFVVGHTNPAVMRACGDIAVQVGRAWDAVRGRAQPRLDYPAYERTVSALIERLAETPKAGVFVDQVAASGTAGMRHAANVCFLSLIMGLKLDFYLVQQRSRLNNSCARDVTNLGVGALLHDIGMARLGDAPTTAWEAGRDDEDGPWRRHVILGHEIVKNEVDPSAAGVVLHHHQHFDGSGFPAVRPAEDKPAIAGVGAAVGAGAAARGVPGAASAKSDEPLAQRGPDIHVFARIVAAADLFDRLRYPPGVPEADTPATVTVLRRMQESPVAGWLDPVVFRALVSVAPPYAPGVWVTLNDGRSAVVEQWSTVEPCRPVVRILDPLAEESWRREVRSERIDLRAHKHLEIAKIEGREVLANNFYLKKGREYDLTGLARGNAA